MDENKAHVQNVIEDPKDKNQSPLNNGFKESNHNIKKFHHKMIINETQSKENKKGLKDEEVHQNDEANGEENKDNHDHGDMVELPQWAQSFQCVFIISLIIFIANKYSGLKIVNIL